MNSNWTTVLYIATSVAIAVLANYVASQWAREPYKWSWWLVALFILSPLVFLSFGFVSQRFGLSVAGAINDSLLTISTIVVGLVVLQEWNRVSPAQYIGMLFAVIGIVLMGLFGR